MSAKIIKDQKESLKNKNHTRHRKEQEQKHIGIDAKLFNVNMENEDYFHTTVSWETSDQRITIMRIKITVHLVICVKQP